MSKKACMACGNIYEPTPDGVCPRCRGVAPPRKPAPGEPIPPLCESNLSATVYAVGALRAARVPPSDPVYEQILGFVARCQNLAEEPERRDDKFDDGGFFFAPGDAAKSRHGKGNS